MSMVEDYRNFGWEAIQESMRQLIEDVKRETGATDEEIALAMPAVAERFMNVNCLALPSGPTEKK